MKWCLFYGKTIDSASELKQQSRVDISPHSVSSQPVFLLSVLSEGLANTNFILTPSEIKLTTARRANYTTDVVKYMYLKLKKN